MSTELDSKLREILDSMWGAGLDFGTSDDFKDLEGDEADEVYLRYQTNKANICIAQIHKAFADEGYQYIDPHLPDLFTGRTWYDRFDNILDKIYKENDGFTSEEETIKAAREAAKRAAGLSE